jgi:hypothetical protein
LSDVNRKVEMKTGLYFPLLTIFKNISNDEIRSLLHEKAFNSFCKKNEAAFKKYSKQVNYHLCFTDSINSEDDICNEMMAFLYEMLIKYYSNPYNAASFGTYFNTCLRNKLFNLKRDERKPSMPIEFLRCEIVDPRVSTERWIDSWTRRESRSRFQEEELLRMFVKVDRPRERKVRPFETLSKKQQRRRLKAMNQASA